MNKIYGYLGNRLCEIVDSTQRNYIVVRFWYGRRLPPVSVPKGLVSIVE